MQHAVSFEDAWGTPPEPTPVPTPAPSQRHDAFSLHAGNAAAAVARVQQPQETLEEQRARAPRRALEEDLRADFRRWCALQQRQIERDRLVLFVVSGLILLFLGLTWRAQQQMTQHLQYVLWTQERLGAH